MNQLRRQCLLFGAAMAATGSATTMLAPQRRGGHQSTVDLEVLFPSAFGSWRTAGALNAFVRPANEPIYRIYEQVLERTYVHAENVAVMLSVAYGGSQSDGLELHRPEICYRYGGFSVRAVRQVNLLLDGATVEVNRLIAERPGRPEPVTYWTTLAGEAVPDASMFRLMNLSYAVRRQDVDGMLVRVSSVDAIFDRAYAIHDRFIGELRTSLSTETRALVFGRPSM